MSYLSQFENMGGTLLLESNKIKVMVNFLGFLTNLTSGELDNERDTIWGAQKILAGIADKINGIADIASGPEFSELIAKASTHAEQAAEKA